MDWDKENNVYLHISLTIKLKELNQKILANERQIVYNVSE